MRRLHILTCPPRQSRPSPGGLLATAALVTVISAAALVVPAVAGLPIPCTLPDNGSFTADMPPNGCGYVSLQLLHIVDGLPPGNPIEIDALLNSFGGVVRTPGGTLGGEMETFDGVLHMDMTGTGGLAGFHRVIQISTACRCDAAPRAPGTPVQSFGHDMMQLQGQITGDPDFDLLRITAGTAFGMPSPGHTTLTLAAPSWSVDSFFDITYRIDFIGHPGGPLGGMSGSTTGTIRMQAGTPGSVANVDNSWGGVKTTYR